MRREEDNRLRREEVERQKKENELRDNILKEEDKEKRELIYEFWLMEQDGIPISKKYTMEDSLDEMRFEYHKIKSECDVKDKVRVAWNMFSCVNGLGEIINHKLNNPLGISLEGWSDELDNEKDKYEPHFRKLYKQWSTRFQVRPGTQIMGMYVSQLLLFLIPRLISKVQKKKEDDKSEDVSKKIYPWAKSKVVEVDEEGTEVPSPETITQRSLIEELKRELQMQKEQLRQQKSEIENQKQLIELFKEQTQMPKVSKPQEEQFNDIMLKKVPETKKVVAAPSGQKEQDNIVGQLPSDTTVEPTVDPYNIDMPRVTGGVSHNLKELYPFMKVFKKMKDKPVKPELDKKLYAEPPENPDSVDHENKLEVVNQESIHVETLPESAEVLAEDSTVLNKAKSKSTRKSSTLILE